MKKGAIDTDQLVKLLIALVIVSIAIYIIVVLGQNQSSLLESFFEKV